MKQFFFFLNLRKNQCSTEILDTLIFSSFFVVEVPTFLFFIFLPQWFLYKLGNDRSSQTLSASLDQDCRNKCVRDRGGLTALHLAQSQEIAQNRLQHDSENRVHNGFLPLLLPSLHLSLGTEHKTPMLSHDGSYRLWRAYGSPRTDRRPSCVNPNHLIQLQA